MKFVVFSDSHGQLDEMRKVLLREKEIDMVLHTGDFGLDIDHVMKSLKQAIPFKRVRGNCDYTSPAPVSLLFKAEGVKILMHHGSGLGVKRSLNKIDYYAREQGADIVIFGHSHLPLVKNMGDLYLLNPGSIGWPKGAGRTYAVIEIDSDKKEKIKIDIKSFT